MRTLRTLGIASVGVWVVSVIAPVCLGQPIADSQADFSITQGQNGWEYGFFNQTLADPSDYSTDAFVLFDTPNNADPANPSWMASAGRMKKAVRGL